MSITILVLLASLIAATQSGKNDEVKLAAQDPRVMLRLFRDFQTTFNKHYSAPERRLRLRNFDRFVKFAARLNERDDGVTYGITYFADLTPEESDRMKGLNVTLSTVFRYGEKPTESDSESDDEPTKPANEEPQTSDSDSETDPDTESDSNSDTDPETDSQSDSTDDEPTKPANEEPQTSDSDSETDPDTESDSNSDTDPDTDSESDSDTEPTKPARKMIRSLKTANNVRYGPVKNQSPCGSCWAFAGVGLIEGHAYLTTGKYVAYSEQEVIDCSANSDCSAGDLAEGLRMVRDQNHLATAAAYPYERANGQCRASQHANALPFKITNHRIVQGDANMLQELQAAPVAVSMVFPRELFAYNSGIYSDSWGACSGTEINHSVVVVGYTNTYWQVRNSWGATWGEEGHVRFSRSVNNICKISAYVNALTVEKTVQEEE